MSKNCLPSRSVLLHRVFLQYMSLPMNSSFCASLTHYLLSFKAILGWWWDGEDTVLLATGINVLCNVHNLDTGLNFQW